MNCENIKTDFNKRYGAECESIYFSGKPLIFLKGKGKVLGSCLSVGCYVAISTRDDERIMVQYSHTDKFLTINASELDINRDNEIFALLSDAQKLGVNVGGARMLFYSNTGLHTPKKALLLASLDSFCDNVPSGVSIFRHFRDFDTAMVEAKGKANYLFLYEGASGRYFPLKNSEYKIVLSHIKDKIIKDYTLEDSRIDGAIEELSAGNYSGFGKILNCETERLIKKYNRKATKNLFMTALELGDSIGNGLLEEGGIFSVVENKKVDSFVRNISLEYRKHFGKDPDFYVTDTQTSGKVY